MRRWRDSSANQRGDGARGSGEGSIAGHRRRTRPQAINVRRGNSRGSFNDDDESRPRGQWGGRRGGTRLPNVSSSPIEPRALVLVGAAALVLIVLAVVLTRSISSPATEPTPVAVAVTSPTPAGPTAVPTQGPVQATIVPLEPTYTVQSGDTLATIARRFNTTVDALVSINNLTDRNSVRVGQRLILPNQ
jgi:LysM repeat protein